MSELKHTEKAFNRLSTIRKNRDIFGRCFAISGGIFCPTYGIARSASLIKDAAVIVIGTPECTWYAKDSCIHHNDDSAYDRFFSCTLDDNDITFGELENLNGAMSEIAQTAQAKCIFLASTCIPEIIGVDIDAIAEEAEAHIGIPVLPIHIAHYDDNCNEFANAISRTLEALGNLMEPQVVNPRSFNILGRNMHPTAEGDLEDTELIQLLDKHGYAMNLALPRTCSIEEIRSAPQVALNIVTNLYGRELAEYMRDRFGTPCVLFEASLDIDYIDQGYSDIQKILGIDCYEDLAKLRCEAEAAIEKTSHILKGKTFVNGGRPPDAIDAAGFFTSMGMEPLLINAYRLTETSEKNIQQITSSGHDPLVNYVPNSDAVMDLVIQMKPDIYIGHGHAEYIEKSNIPQVETLIPPGKLGYRAISHALNAVAAVLEGDAADEDL